MTTSLPMSPQVFAILAGLVEERAGLHYGQNDRDVFGERVSLRAMERGFDSLLDYYYYLKYDPAGGEELDQLLEALVVGETYFFRELLPLEVAVDQLIAPKVAEGGRPRIWSAACATGEEPLTLAMLLESRGLLGRVDLWATDLSQRALARAQLGLHGPRSVRPGAPLELQARYLTRENGGWRVPASLTSAIHWQRLNLVDRDAVAAMGPFDVIFCRNVLIYFDDETTRRVVGSLTDRLVPGGALFVSVSESLMRFGASLTCEEHHGVFLYRKPA
jgi:chemotaxis protein methyltransferase CheR